MRSSLLFIAHTFKLTTIIVNISMSGSQSKSSNSSPTIDEVFFKLAVNFLLYVAFITIFYLLVKFYLEEEVTNEGGLGNLGVSYSALPSEILENEEMDSQLDSNKDKHSHERENNKSFELNLEDKDEEYNILHSEGKEEEEEIEKERTSSFNINEWGEPQGTRQEVFQQLLFCSSGLIFIFSIWGLLQERILTLPYGDNEFFIYSYGLVFINRLGGLILSGYLLYYFKIKWYSSPLWEYSIPSCANMLSSWCQYEALKYVSFPTQMIAKSFKMLPTMLMGSFLHNKTYESYEFISAATVGFGLYLFIYSSEGLDVGKNLIGDAMTTKGIWCGVVLLLLFLFFDSFNGQWQTRMFQVNKEVNKYFNSSFLSQ